MTLAATTFGTGPDLVLLHGWGMHSGIWEEFAQRLAQQWRITLIDLPGHGGNRAHPTPYTLHTVAAQVMEYAPPRAHWLGWSLGGLIALQISQQFPARVDQLVLMASSPQFVRSSDWPHAMGTEVLAQFAGELQRDFRATVLRFLALEVQGSATAREELRLLRERVFARGEPHPDALSGGLEILRQTNLRPALNLQAQKILLLLGERDRLVPPTVGTELKRLQPQLESRVIEGAGHAPFLSHPEICAQHIADFLHV